MRRCLAPWGAVFWIIVAGCGEPDVFRPWPADPVEPVVEAPVVPETTPVESPRENIPAPRPPEPTLDDPGPSVFPPSEHAPLEPAWSEESVPEEESSRRPLESEDPAPSDEEPEPPVDAPVDPPVRPAADSGLVGPSIRPGVIAAERARYEEAIRSGPDPARAVCDLIDYLLLEGDPVSAHEVAEREARQIDEQDFDTLLLLARLYQQLGEVDRTSRYLEQARILHASFGKSVEIGEVAFRARFADGSYRATDRTAYKTNERLYIRVDLRNWGLKSVDSGYRTEQTLRLSIVDSRGTELPLGSRSGEFRIDKDFKSSPKVLFHILERIPVPFLEPGNYAIRVKLTDHLKEGAAGEATRDLPLEIQE